MKKLVLITGASSGIGKAAALRLAEKGFHVLAGVRQEKDLAQWNNVPNAEGLLLDICFEESVKAAISRISPQLEAAREVHLLNNAGIALGGPVEGVPMNRWREQFEVNVFGLIRITQALLPYIRASQRGRIINMSSVSGLATSPYLVPYSASKFAVEAISDGLRRELRQFGCKVIVIEPGPIATPIWEKGLREQDSLYAELSSEVKNAYGRELAIFRKGIKKSTRNAVSVEKVAETIEEALTSRKPRPRYVVGARGLNLFMKALRIIPEGIVDNLVAHEFRERKEKRS